MNKIRQSKITSILLAILFITIILFPQPATAQNDQDIYTFPYDDSLDPVNYRGLQTIKAGNYSIAANTEYTQIYNIILNALLNLETSVDLSNYPIGSQSTFDILQTVLNDHPEIFYHDYSKTVYFGLGNLQLGYLYDHDTLVEMKTALDNKVDAILASEITDDMTDLQKEIALHDYLVLHTAYDYDNYLKGTIPRESYTTYGTLINNTAVCAGYALTMKLLLNKVDIECIYITGNPLQNHAWNLVYLNDNWYHLDVTWDDPAPDTPSYVRYKFFNQSATTFYEDSSPHKWVTEDYPIAISETYAYFHTMDSSVARKDDTIYYSDNTDNNALYAIDIWGSNKTKLTETRSYYPCLYGDTIYYANYSRGARIYSIKTDGSENTMVLDTSAKNLRIEGNKLYYNDYYTNELNYIELQPITYAPEDHNQDGTIDIQDLTYLKNHYSNYTPNNPTNLIDIQDIITLSKILP